MPQISKRMRMMQYLNNTEKKACKAFVALTHAFFCLPTSSEFKEARELLLSKRWDCVRDFPRARNIAWEIESNYWAEWCDKAIAAGSR